MEGDYNTEGLGRPITWLGFKTLDDLVDACARAGHPQPVLPPAAASGGAESSAAAAQRAAEAAAEAGAYGLPWKSAGGKVKAWKKVHERFHALLRSNRGGIRDILQDAMDHRGTFSLGYDKLKDHILAEIKKAPETAEWGDLGPSGGDGDNTKGTGSAAVSERNRQIREKRAYYRFDTHVGLEPRAPPLAPAAAAAAAGPPAGPRADRRDQRVRVEADLTERAIHETVKKNGRKSTGEPRTGDDVVIDLEDDESVQFFAKMARNLPNVVPQVDVQQVAELARLKQFEQDTKQKAIDAQFKDLKEELKEEMTKIRSEFVDLQKAIMESIKEVLSKK